ncbi:MAG: BamA/TamA family outer membrane protein [Calditrichaeota bacterium]|nr:BamA/TamA family outer membrane protein [Calditrichota bacterium]
MSLWRDKAIVSLVAVLLCMGLWRSLSADSSGNIGREAAFADEVAGPRQTEGRSLEARDAGSAGRAKVLSVRILGTHAVSEEQALQWANIRPGAPWGAHEAEERSRALLESYRREGYPWARVDSIVAHYSTDSSGVKVSFWIEEGPLARIGTIAINGVDEEWHRLLLARFDSRPGRPFVEEVLRRDLQEALSEFENRGYPFAQLVLDSLSLREEEESRLLDICLSAFLGPQVRIDEVRVVGATTTKRQVIARAAGLRSGQLYSQRTMERVPARLKRLPFIESADPPVAFVGEQGTGGVLLTVRERKASSIDGVLGYNPGVGTEKGYLTGLLDLSLGNLFGTARALQARWQKRDQKTQELRFSYREPWVLGSPLSLGCAFEQLVQDTTYVRRDLALELSLPLADRLTAKVQLGRGEVLPDSLATALLGMPRSRSLTGALGVEYDTRDDLLNPRSGFFYQTALSVDRKKQFVSPDQQALYGVPPRVDNRRVIVDAELYVQPLRYQVVAIAVHGRQVTSTQGRIPIEDQFRFGGARTLRGYREHEFRGSKVAWSNVEYRYLLGRRSRAFVFLDGGYYWREDAHQTSEGYRIGYGCGVRIETGLGIVGVDLGLGKGDSLMETKVHVGLVNEF